MRRTNGIKPYACLPTGLGLARAVSGSIAPATTSQVAQMTTMRRRTSAFLGTSSMLPYAVPSTNHQQRRSIVVESNATPNPECLRFFSMELSFLPPGTAMDLPNEGHAYKSPLAEHLFKVSGIKQVYFADEYITVTKDKDANWGDLTPMVQEVVISFSDSGENILSPDISSDYLSSDNDTDPEPWDDEVVLAVKELLHTRIRPMLKSDGGNLTYVGIEEGSVYVMLEGACKTCPSSGTTLKVGIERMLMHWIPEVSEVLEVDQDFAYDFKNKKENERKEAEEKKAEETA